MRSHTADEVRPADEHPSTGAVPLTSGRPRPTHPVGSRP
jgi:hypothetical protein